MGARAKGLRPTINRLIKKQASVPRAAHNVIIEHGLEIQELAVLFAPRDTSSLENAIRIDAGIMDTKLNAKVIIFVDEGFYNETRGKFVGEYAQYISDNLNPAGILNLGPRSAEKQASQSEKVGGKYFDRAFDEMAPETIPLVRRAVKQAMRRR